MNCWTIFADLFSVVFAQKEKAKGLSKLLERALMILIII